MAIIVSQSGGGGALIAVVIIIVAIIGFYIWRTRSTTTTVTQPPAPVPAAPAPTETEEEPPPAEGEQPTETVQGDTPYPGTLAEELNDEGQGTRHYASGKPDDVTHEWEGSTSLQSYMVLIDITLTEIDHDDQISFKFGGTHTGSGWYDFGYDFESGKACAGKEEDHPSTDLCVTTGRSIGSLVNTPAKLCAVNFNKGEKLELWSNLGSGWTKDVESSNGVGGFRPSVDNDDVTIRIDAAPGIEMRHAAIYELSATSPSTGGGTTTPTQEEDGEGEEAGAVQSGANPALCQSRYHGSCNTECSSRGSTSECNACRVACGTGSGAGAVQTGGTDPSRCQSEFFGKCNTECSGGSSSRCSACQAACGSANLARAFSARRRLYNNMRYAFSIDTTGDEDSDVDWDYGWNWERNRPSLQSTAFSARRYRSLRLGNFI